MSENMVDIPDSPQKLKTLETLEVATPQLLVNL